MGHDQGFYDQIRPVRGDRVAYPCIQLALYVVIGLSALVIDNPSVTEKGPTMTDVPDTQPGGTSSEKEFSNKMLASLRRSAEHAIQNGDGAEGYVTAYGAVLLIDEIQKYRAADAATPSTPVVPRRLEGAIHNPGFRALVLRGSHLDAIEALHDDARRLTSLGLEDVMTISSALMKIKLTNGSVILYIGGTQQWRDDRVRGLLIDHIDGEHLIDHRIAAIITRSGS